MTEFDLNQKNILVTGGTGSFGKAFATHLLKNFHPERLVIFSRDEQKQYDMMRTLTPAQYPVEYVLGDVRDYTKLQEVTKGMDLIVHSAAMKHLPMAEDNPFEAIQTNILGSQNLIRASIENGVSKVVALSTDKAALPINVYGATKLLLEKLFVAADKLKSNEKTRFSVVRYANVFGSKGSVVPLFQQLKHTGELPITHPKMSRFSISLEDGIDLVLFAAQQGWGGEIIVPIAPSYYVGDVATAICESCSQKIIGARASEKMHEVLIAPEESRRVVKLDTRYIIAPQDGRWTQEEHAKKMGGLLIDQPFEYNSGTNSNWLTVEQIREHLKQIE